MIQELIPDVQVQMERSTPRCEIEGNDGMEGFGERMVDVVEDGGRLRTLTGRDEEVECSQQVEKLLTLTKEEIFQSLL